MEVIKSKRYTEDEIEELIREYTSRFGGENIWEKDGRYKNMLVRGARVIYDYHDKQLSIYGDMGTARMMFQILQIKREREIKDERTQYPKTKQMYLWVLRL